MPKQDRAEIKPSRANLITVQQGARSTALPLPLPEDLARPLPSSLIATAMNPYLLVLTVSGWINRHQQSVIEYLQAENRALREQLGPKRIRWTDAQRKVPAEKARAVGRAALTELGPLLRWYRKLVAAKYDGSKRRKPGRRRTKPAIANLVVSAARDNPRWGYTRIRGALRNTVKRILLELGLEPAPERGRHTSWAFLHAHMGAIAEVDFFTVEVKPHAVA